MRKFGLKLWSKDFVKNKDFVKDAEIALKNGKFDFLELFALENSFDDVANDVKSMFLGIKTVIHAPHGIQGLDISNKDEFLNNQKRIEDARRFADIMDACYIVLHPGMNRGDKYLEESIRQFKGFNDKRLTVENLPTYCSQTKKTLHGVTPLEIKKFIDEVQCPFCLDFSHAICGANGYNCDVYGFLDDMFELKPSMYHLCDGYMGSDNDSHLHFGMGNYDLKKLISKYTTLDALITMETGHGIPQTVKPWIDDINYLKGLLGEEI